MIAPISERAPVLKPLSLKELLDAFGDCPAALVACNSNIRRLSVIVRDADRIKWNYQYSHGGFTATFLSMMIDHLFPGGAFSQESRQLKKLRQFRDCVKARERGDSMTINIEKARAVPITELIECKRKGGRWWAACFAHTDKTFSFMVNKDGRTAHCFSCGGHWDAIGMVMKRDGLTFLEAVRYLNG